MHANPGLSLSFAAILAFVVVGCGGGDAVEESLLLPDLDQRAPATLRVDELNEGQFVLRFDSAVDNVGPGELLLDASRESADETMSARQVLVNESGEQVSREEAATLHYDEVEDHGHWHIRGFQTYVISDLEGAIVARDVKSGFCLVDSYDAFLDVQLAGEPEEAVHTGQCGEGEPELTRVTLGISVGYGDFYSARLHDQWIPLAGLAEGQYQLIHTSNPDQAIEEASYANNAASVLVELNLPDGPGGSPRVQVVRECPDTPECLPEP